MSKEEPKGLAQFRRQRSINNLNSNLGNKSAVPQLNWNSVNPPFSNRNAEYSKNRPEAFQFVKIYGFPLDEKESKNSDAKIEFK